MLNGKAMIILLIAGLIKKTLYKMSQYFQYFKPYNRFEGNVKVELDLFNYAPKTDLKGATGTDASHLALKSNLAELKAAVEKINLAKLKSVPVDSSKLSNVVNNEAVKKTVYDKLVAKVNHIDASEFVLKTKYDTDKSSLVNKKIDADRNTRY